MTIDFETSIYDVEYVAFDVETTGLNESYDHIIEIAAIRFSIEKTIDIFHYLIKPPVAIPRELSKRIHGITNDMVSNANSIDQILPDFVSFVSETVLVGHNIGFDLRFINAALSRMKASVIENMPIIDTYSLARKVFPDIGSYNLEYLVDRLGLGGETFHRAKEDAMNTKQLLIKCIDEISILGELKLKELLVS